MKMKKTERIQFRVSKPKKDFIRKQCVKENITISEFMTKALAAYEIKEKQ